MLHHHALGIVYTLVMIMSMISRSFEERGIMLVPLQQPTFAGQSLALTRCTVMHTDPSF